MINSETRAANNKASVFKEVPDLLKETESSEKGSRMLEVKLSTRGQVERTQTV